MIHEGQIVLFRFPQTDQTREKLRPALVLCRLPGHYDDWLICMISSQLSQALSGFDEIIKEEDPDFEQSGLKKTSVVRISRLAVVGKNILLGASGEIETQRLIRIKIRLADWLKGSKNKQNAY